MGFLLSLRIKPETGTLKTSHTNTSTRVRQFECRACLKIGDPKNCQFPIGTPLKPTKNKSMAPRFKKKTHIQPSKNKHNPTRTNQQKPPTHATACVLPPPRGWPRTRPPGRSHPPARWGCPRPAPGPRCRRPRTFATSKRTPNGMTPIYTIQL